MKLSRIVRPMLTIIGALVGAVLGSAIQTALDSQLRLASSGIAVLCLLTLGLLTIYSAHADRASRMQEQLLGRASDVANDVRVQVTSIVSTVDAQQEFVAKHLDALSRQFGMHVTFQLLAQLNSMKSLEADAVSQMMISAKGEILVVDILSSKGVWPDQAMRSDHMHKHFDRVVQHVKASAPPIAYKRVVQVEDPANPFMHATSPALMEHLRKMHALRLEDHLRVAVKVAQKRFPFKFIIVDRRAVALQLQQFDEDGTSLLIWGEIVITDANPELIKIFLELWQDIEDDVHTRAVTWKELSAPASTPMTSS